MKRYILILAGLLLALTAVAQPDRRELRQGNRQFRKGEYRQADVSYRKALLKDSTSLAANYNLGNNLYRQQNYEEAAKYMTTATSLALRSDSWYNLGDIALARQDWKGAVDAFKKSLLLHPDDLDAKENYIYAKKKLEEQQNQDQNQDQQNQDQNQDQNQNQNQNQDQNQDQQNQPSQDPSQNPSQDPSQDSGQNPSQDPGQDGQQPQPQEAKISPQQAQQMLKAIQAKEKETQDKVKKEKAEALQAAQKEKNW